MDAPRRRLIHDAMVRLSDGDRSALPILVDELWPVILAFVQRGVGHEDGAEDVAQEVFLRLCSRISALDRERDGLSWAFGIAAYEIMTHRRRHQRRREVLNAGELERKVDPASSQEERVIQRQLALALTEAVGALSEADRAALGIMDAPSEDQPATAALRKRRQRALDRLRTVWRRLYGEP